MGKHIIEEDYPQSCQLLSSPIENCKSLTDHGQRSTALLIEPQTFFSLVIGEKADNQII